MDALGLPQGVAILALIAATLPLVGSVFAAFHPSTKVAGTSEFFLYSGQVDIDSFLKASIGYSLQVASIYLFFSWAISYGLWLVLVAAAWCGGFILVAAALKNGFLDGFIFETKEHPITIHGFVAEQLKTNNVWLRYSCVLTISLATIIGLGGTMITE